MIAAKCHQASRRQSSIEATFSSKVTTISARIPRKSKGVVLEKGWRRQTGETSMDRPSNVNCAAASLVLVGTHYPSHSVLTRATSTVDNG